MFNRVFVIFNFFVVIVFAINAIPAFLSNHTYYSSMMANPAHWELIFMSIIFSLIPIGYLILFKKKTFIKFIIALFFGLFFFGLGFISTKGAFIGKGTIIWFINVAIMLLLSCLFLVGVLAIGIVIRERFIKIDIKTIYDIVITFGFGLVIFILINYVLILLNIYHPIIAWLLLLGMAVLIYIQKQRLFQIQEKLFSCFDNMHIGNIANNQIVIVGVILLLFSIMYYYYGFVLSYIPYPTAWDANHAYLFYPKMWAHNMGFTWDVQGLITTPYLWYSYLTYWFVLFIPFENSFWISSNTFAVEMNFLSGIFVLLFGIALVRELIEVLKIKFNFTFVGKNIDSDENKSLLETKIHEKVIFYVGRFLILLWLTSGMGAFLVFVDNKTDLGVLTLIIFAIYSGLIFIKKVHELENNGENNKDVAMNQTSNNQNSKKLNNKTKQAKQNNWQKSMRNKEIIFSLLSSAFFFAIAAMAKPTALLDAVNFGMLLFGLWLGLIGLIGVFSFIVGLLAALQYRGIGNFLDKVTGKRLLGIGSLLIFIDPIRSIVKNNVKKLIYILVWGLTFFLTIFILKGPVKIGVAISSENQESVMDTVVGIFLSKNNKIDIDKIIESDNSKKLHYYLDNRTLFAGTEDVYLDVIDTNSDVFTSAVSTGGSNLTSGQNNVLGTAKKLDVISTGDISITTGVVDTSTVVLDPDKAQVTPASSCSIRSAGINNNSELYESLTEVEGDTYSEDVGRYVGYGRKTFDNPYWGTFFPSFDQHIKCYSLDSSLTKLCEHNKTISSRDANQLNSLLADLNPKSKGYNILSGLINNSDVESQSGDIKILEYNEDSYKGFTDVIQSKTIKVERICHVPSDKIKEFNQDCKIVEEPLYSKIYYDKKISVPYDYLRIFNITFNWSLQNHSSYYTDIGFVWLLITIFIGVALLFGIGKLNRFLITISIVNVLGWTIWFYIGGGILWYGIGLIVWTIMSFLSYLYYLYDEQDINLKYFYYIFLVLLSMLFLYQIMLNFVRISSQGGGGPFMWYKIASGKDVIFDENLKSKQETIIGYNRKDVFEQQFGHYNKFLNLANSREEGEGILLAGTYARYFVEDQKNLIYDQMLTWLMKMFSDGDICKSYLRLKDKNIKYLAIDPNIGTVVMGGGNISLFHRFFAKINNETGKIEKDGTITMLLRMKLNGYLDYSSTNNIGLKYAFVVSDSDLEKVLGKSSNQEEIFMMRARLATTRFWASNNFLNELILNLAKHRVVNGQFLGDLADSYGKVVDEKKLLSYASKYFNREYNKNPQQFKTDVSNLNNDERFILIQYLNLYQYLTKDPDKFDQIVMKDIINRSINSSSQILVLELK